MKKLIKTAALLIALAMLVPFAGCTFIESILNPEPTDVPAPTDTPAPDVRINKEFLGDWYGVFSVSETGGKYKPNENVKNDCVMRISANESGIGCVYAVVNGMGELFDSVAAAVLSDTVTIKGSFCGREVEWHMDLFGRMLVTSQFFGDDTDYMYIEMKLMHCGEEWDAEEAPAGYEYTLKHGFGDLVTIMGGSRENLPEVTVPGVNLRLTTDVDPGPGETPAPGFHDEGRVTSEGGNFSVVLPEGFSIARNNEFDFVLTNKDIGVISVSFNVTESDEDPLEKLINEPTQWSVSKGYFVHYTIDEFDCYAAAVNAEGSSGNSRILVYGTDGTYFLTVEYLVATDVMRAWAIIDDVPDANFSTIVLGALISGRGE